MDGTTELDSLIAAQQHDDTETIRPEFPWQVPFTNGIANCIGVDMDGEIETHWPRPPKGTLLTGSAPWHGTDGGYTRNQCRCQPCTKAHADALRRYRQRRNGGS